MLARVSADAAREAIQRNHGSVALALDALQRDSAPSTSRPTSTLDSTPSPAPTGEFA
jgi:hypothetical protein